MRCAPRSLFPTSGLNVPGRSPVDTPNQLLKVLVMEDPGITSWLPPVLEPRISRYATKSLRAAEPD